MTEELPQQKQEPKIESRETINQSVSEMTETLGALQNFVDREWESLTFEERFNLRDKLDNLKKELNSVFRKLEMPNL